MITAIIGQVGSGKSLSAVRHIIKSNKKSMTNFEIFTKNTYRLKVDDIITNLQIGEKKNGDPINVKDVNWEFWSKVVEERKDIQICIDELHNLASSRRFMSTTNLIVLKWLSQIRKILGNAENSEILLISQIIERIDIGFRDLLDKIIFCEKVVFKERLVKTQVREKGKLISKMLPKVMIFQYHFNGAYCLKNFNEFKENGFKSYDIKNAFIGNQYFKYYDSYELTRFGESDYL